MTWNYINTCEMGGTGNSLASAIDQKSWVYTLASKPPVAHSMKNVGWVEHSETHHGYRRQVPSQSLVGGMHFAYPTLHFSSNDRLASYTRCKLCFGSAIRTVMLVCGLILLSQLAPTQAKAQAIASPSSTPSTRQEPTLSTTMRQLLDQLAAGDYQTRELATTQLLTDELITPKEIVELYAMAKTPEQRHRLMAIARHHQLRQQQIEHFPQDDKASIGIIHRGMGRSQLPPLDRPAVRVVHTFPGFPGYAYLRPGDLILTVDDQPMPDSSDPGDLANQFVAMIQRFRCNESVRFHGMARWRNPAVELSPRWHQRITCGL